MTKKPAKAKPVRTRVFDPSTLPNGIGNLTAKEKILSNMDPFRAVGERNTRLFWLTAVCNTAVRYLTKDGGPCWCPTYVPGIPSANHKKGTRCAITRALINGEKGPHPFEVWKKRLSKADREIP